jgi:hypothetical protein
MPKTKESIIRSGFCLSQSVDLLFEPKMQIFVSNYSCNNPLQMDRKSTAEICGLDEQKTTSGIVDIRVSSSARVSTNSILHNNLRF